MDTLLTKHYEVVRQEAVARLLARDRLLVLYLGAVGALFGIAFGKEATREIVVIVPFIALGVSLMLRDHELVLLRLGQWIRDEYEAYIREYVKGELKQEAAAAVAKLRFPIWDTSPVLREYGEREIGPRYAGYALLFGLSSITGVIWFAVSAGISVPPLSSCLAISAFVAKILVVISAFGVTIFTQYLVWISFRDRRRSSGRQVSS